MDVYIYQADIFCLGCGDEICRELREARRAPLDPSDEHSFDSDDYPKGPYEDGGGEADVPQHCGGCGVFLENPLTSDGADYVRERLTSGQGNQEVLATWRDFYGCELGLDIETY